MKLKDYITSFLPLSGLMFTMFAMTREFAFFSYFDLKAYQFLNISELVFRNIGLLTITLIFVAISLFANSNKKEHKTSIAFRYTNSSKLTFIERLRMYISDLLPLFIVIGLGMYFVMIGNDQKLEGSILRFLLFFVSPFLSLILICEFTSRMDKSKVILPKNILSYVLLFPLALFFVFNSGYTDAANWKSNDSKYNVILPDRTRLKDEIRIIDITNNSVIVKIYKSGKTLIFPRNQVQLEEKSRVRHPATINIIE